jgi:acyl carrier protein
MIIDSLKLEEISADEIDDDAPLFKEGLGLDSIDALELVVAIEKVFNVIIEDEDVGKEAFGSIRILAGFIQREYTRSDGNTISAAG